MDETESLLVSLGPLEVVHQAPQEIPTDVKTIAHGAAHFMDVGVQIVDALSVVEGVSVKWASCSAQGVG